MRKRAGEKKRGSDGAGVANLCCPLARGGVLQVRPNAGKFDKAGNCRLPNLQGCDAGERRNRSGLNFGNRKVNYD